MATTLDTAVWCDRRSTSCSSHSESRRPQGASHCAPLLLPAALQVVRALLEVLSTGPGDVSAGAHTLQLVCGLQMMSSDASAAAQPTGYAV